MTLLLLLVRNPSSSWTLQVSSTRDTEKKSKQAAVTLVSDLSYLQVLHTIYLIMDTFDIFYKLPEI